MQNTLIKQDIVVQKANIKARIESVDFECVVYKLMHDEDGPDWTLDECDTFVDLYKKYLFLNAVYPELNLPPTKEIDTVWHDHIFDTSKYMVDCDNIFGYFFHHYPYFGLNGAEDAKNLADSFEITKLLFKEHFEIDLMLLGGQVMDCRDDCVSIPCGGPPNIGNMTELDRAKLLAALPRPKMNR